MSLINTNLISDSLISEQLEGNIAFWLNHELLGVCAYFNVSLPSSGTYGGSASRLRLSDDPNYNAGQVWESYRKQWIWQTGITCAIQPIQISGVYVNNIFRPATGVGPYAFTIDYPNGRIIFNSGISTSSTVKAEYSFNYYQIYNADSPWWKDIQRNSFRVDDNAFLITASGFWSKPPESRLQMPAVIVEGTSNMRKTPRQLGNHAAYHEQDIRFYIITETHRDMKWIVDTITNQYDVPHEMFDMNLIYASGVQPLNMDGSINNTGQNYPDLVKNFPYNRPWNFERFRSINNDGLATKSENPLFSSIIDATVFTYV